MNILSFTTTTSTMSAAVSVNGRTVGEYTTFLKQTHSQRLMPAIDSLLKETGVKAGDLDAIAAAKGPGSYTGVRISVTTAKTLAWSLQIPVYGISSLHLLAEQAKLFSGWIVPFIDARRDHVYTGIYYAENGICRRMEADGVLDVPAWIEKLQTLEGPVLLIGEEADKHKERIMADCPDVQFASAEQSVPRASSLAAIAEQHEDLAVHAHELVPEYAQLAEAEKKWLEAGGGSRP
ncbi:tRNA threonylcarbamoyladenosine biosynthesis protein TsaB [Sinobaca qinghaiensis]|uniref:tRNA threonylcarbamoyladenosine biosynthesis protein TsaB n=1 Tax=Sinobaca qinghaiensis TaxID=342944 RepID=A0A419V0G9_9BACL|nr:tRNA (adenosine(37)-N6)-threonylcarbamoyltransferase complex dimerization subunit type 1 TsaB [Sinobaca qinghaiensis]RKD71428.1 tRNA threonylcarbamoyladenosine biosynthesis protein TsaB [Sinobaca qinghaiensis]